MGIYINNHRVLTEEDDYVNANLMSGTTSEWQEYNYEPVSKYAVTSLCNPSKVVIEPNRTYTASAIVKNLSDSTVNTDLEVGFEKPPYNIQSTVKLKPGETGKLVVTFKVDADYVLIHLRSTQQTSSKLHLLVKNAKLELGSRATMWTDNFAKQSDLNSLISRIQTLESKMGGYLTKPLSLLFSLMSWEVA